jgi:replication factor C subunit 3/5
MQHSSDFYNKYTPTKIDAFIIDPDLKTIIQTFMKINALNLLFVGDTGTGKTSIINAILSEYYGKSAFGSHQTNFANSLQSNSPILYVTNLKEQSVHYFRQNIKTFCQTACDILGKKKTIVVDDIDQIDTAIQQVIRNNIDKFDHKINFIFSCSNIQKVLDNIQSRSNVIKLNNMDKSSLMNILNVIIEKEEMQLTQECKELLVNISNNSARIMIGHLEKLKLYSDVISINDIKYICTNISYKLFDEYTKQWFTYRDVDESSKILLSIYDLGYSVMDILENYFGYIKITDVIDNTIKLKILAYFCKYINIFQSIHEDKIELVIFTNEIISLMNKNGDLNEIHNENNAENHNENAYINMTTN